MEQKKAEFFAYHRNAGFVPGRIRGFHPARVLLQKL
jgi:hypothetical protein